MANKSSRLHSVLIALLLTFVSATTTVAKRAVDNRILTVHVTTSGKQPAKNVSVIMTNNGYKYYPDSVHHNDFIFHNALAGVNFIIVSADGYETVKDTVMTRSGNTIKNICLTDRIIQLKTVVVKGKQPAIVYKGDTIMLNPNAVNIEEGDAVREMLEQMPGVDINQNSVSVQGKNVERTYVDGKRTFGDNPMTAIDHVAANDVIKIKMYEEDNRDDYRHGARRRKRWVFNIVTKSKLINSYDAAVVAGLGRTLGNQEANNHKTRGMVGGVFNFFSEDLMLTSNLTHNNINIPSNSTRLLFQPDRNFPNYEEGTHAGFDLIKSQDSVKLGLSRIAVKYAYTRKATEYSPTITRDYTPTEMYDSRTYTQAQRELTQDNIHRASLDMKVELGKIGWGLFTFEGATDNNHANSSQDILDVVGSSANAVTDNITSKSRNKNDDFKGTMLYQTPLGKHENMLQVRAEFSYNSKKGDLTNLSSGHVSENQLINSTTRNNVWKTETKYQYVIGNKFDTWRAEWLAGYNFLHDSGMKDRNGKDADTGDEDVLNTYNYHSHLNQHTPYIEFIGAYKANYSQLVVEWHHNRLSDTKTMSSAEQSRHTFCNWGINWKNDFNTFRNRLASTLQYTLSSTLPTVDQLRNTVNNANPMYVQSGNPALRQMLTHTVLFNNNLRLDNHGTLLTLEMAYKNHKDHIAPRTWYFDSDTYLSSLGYLAPAYTTLASYDNAGRAWSTDVRARMEIPLTSLRSSMRVFASNMIEKTPYYYNSLLSSVKVCNTQGGLLVRTSLIPHTYLTATPSLSYRSAQQEGEGIRNDILTARLQVALQVKRFLKYFFFNANYTLSHVKYKTLGRLDNENVLNIYCGAKVFRGKGEINLTARDVLNSYSAHRVLVTENYTQWTDNVNYGRMFCVNFVWNFRKVKSPRMDVSRGTMW